MTNITYKKDNRIFQFQFETSNSKTGNMVQSFILPIDWITSDKKIQEIGDSSVCFDCEHNMSNKKDCYVIKGNSLMGLLSKVRSLRKKGIDSIPEFDSFIEEKILEAVKGRAVRFGSYGEPVLLGEDLISKIAERASYWTGYTHQWHTNNWAKKFFMASVESNLINRAAQAMGWRTFFVGKTDDSSLITCPASKEAGYKTTCENCKLCMGTTSRAKSIKINKH